MHLKSSFLSASLVLVSTALAAQLEQVPSYGGNAKNVAMYVYKPDNVTPDPALVVVVHSCGSTAQNYFQNSLVPWHQGSDGKGYITIWPSSPNSGGCWDVSSQSSLTHNGGGDSNAIANMITYAIDEYGANSSQVFVTGGSSGAMMSNVLAATYPELIQAVSLYSGVPAGCFVSSSNQVAAWNNTCSGGQSIETQDAWAQTVFNMYPDYDGTYPRMQFWHGSVDTTLYPQNYNETVKQWTGVFGYSETPESSSPNTPDSGYTTQDFGPSVQGSMHRV